MDKKFIFNQILLITISFLAFGMEDPNPKHSNAKRKKEEPATINNLGFKKLKIDEEEEETEEHNIDKIITQISSEEAGNDENNLLDHSENENSSITLIQQLPPHLMPLLLGFVQNLSSLDKFSNQQSIKMLNASNDQIQYLRDSYLCGNNMNQLPPELMIKVLEFVIFEKAASWCAEFAKLDLGAAELVNIPEMLHYAILSIFEKFDRYMHSFKNSSIPAHIVSFPDTPYLENIVNKQIIKHLSIFLSDLMSGDSVDLLEYIYHSYHRVGKCDFLFTACINSHEQDLTKCEKKYPIEGISIKFEEGPYLIDFALTNGFKRLVKLLIERKALQILIDKGLTFFDIFGFSDPYECIDNVKNEEPQFSRKNTNQILGHQYFPDRTSYFTGPVVRHYHTSIENEQPQLVQETTNQILDNPPFQCETVSYGIRLPYLPLIPSQVKRAPRFQKLIKKISDEFKKSKAKSKTNV